MCIRDSQKDRGLSGEAIHTHAPGGSAYGFCCGAPGYGDVICLLYTSTVVRMSSYQTRLGNRMPVSRNRLQMCIRDRISTTLKTKAARRDIPIPKCLTDCLREVKEKTESDYVIADRNGQPLSSSQFQRVWKYVTVRSTKPHTYYKYVNGQCVKCTVTPTPGSHQKNNPKLVYAIDFDVTPHQPVSSTHLDVYKRQSLCSFSM